MFYPKIVLQHEKGIADKMMFGESTSRCDKILIDVWINILPQDPFAGKEFFVPEAFPILTGKAVTIELKERGEPECKGQERPLGEALNVVPSY